MGETDRNPQVGGGEVAAAWVLAAAALFALFVAGWVGGESEPAPPAASGERTVERPEAGRWHNEAHNGCGSASEWCVGPRR